jgi:hypothetical protein
MISRDNVDMVTQDDIATMERNEYDRRQNEQYAIFELLRERVDKLLENFGRPDFTSGQRVGDYFVHGDYNEYPRVVVFVGNLKLLRPTVVNAVQRLVKEFPGWQVDLMVALLDRAKDWPNMGLSVRSNEIVDDLKIQYFPRDFQDLGYEGSRRGTVFD